MQGQQKLSRNKRSLNTPRAAPSCDTEPRPRARRGRQAAWHTPRRAHTSTHGILSRHSKYETRTALPALCLPPGTQVPRDVEKVPRVPGNLLGEILESSGGGQALIPHEGTEPIFGRGLTALTAPRGILERHTAGLQGCRFPRARTDGFTSLVSAQSLGALDCH